ncbi:MULTISPECIES: hypothetical protein [unclassified Psychrobacter]|uniref:hypothetical protein n=1 Tax=unclassified Psychrobacter TaxID=196806 RepID=UPI003FD39AC1
MLLGDKARLKEVHDHIAALSDAKDLLGVNIERRKLVVRWLYIFGYSNREALLKLTNAKGSTGYRFIADLIKHGYIQKFKNNFYSKDLLMLGKQGLGVLLEDRIIDDNQAKLPNKRKFIDSSRVHHEVGLHKSVLAYLLRQTNRLKLLEISKEIRYKPLMVDALLRLDVVKAEAVIDIAFEYERTEKSRQRIEYLLVEHMKNIEKGHYYMTVLCFDNKVLHDYYLKIMLAQPREWSKNKKGQLYGARAYNSTRAIRNRFDFMLINGTNSKTTKLEHIEQDKTHRLHSYLAEVQRKEEDDREVAEEAEYDRREQIEEDLRPKLIEQLTPQLEKQIEERLRAEFEAQYNKPKGLLGKVLGN